MSKLASIIERKKHEADLNPGRNSTQIELSGGMKMTIKKLHGGSIPAYRVYISRDGQQPPSETEIQTFIEHWPAAKTETADFQIGAVFTIHEKEPKI